MWISKKRWESLEKRIADLEGQVQGQQVQSKEIDYKIKQCIQNYCRDSRRKSSRVE